MLNYQGNTKNTDQPSDAGSFVRDNKDGGEVFNFKPYKGKLHGYAWMQDDRNLNISRLGAKNTDNYNHGVTVVFFATIPITSGQYVIGWYKNARLFRRPRPIPVFIK